MTASIADGVLFIEWVDFLLQEQEKLTTVVTENWARIFVSTLV